MAQIKVRRLDDDKKKLQRRAVRSDGSNRTRLGSRIVARFRRIGLDEDIPELRGQSVRELDRR